MSGYDSVPAAAYAVAAPEVPIRYEFYTFVPSTARFTLTRWDYASDTIAARIISEQEAAEIRISIFKTGFVGSLYRLPGNGIAILDASGRTDMLPLIDCVTHIKS